MVVPIVIKHVNICIVSRRNPCLVGASDISLDANVPLFNPFKLNGISHCYQLDQSISVLRVVG